MEYAMIMIGGFMISCIMGYIMIDHLVDLIQSAGAKERYTEDDSGEDTEDTDLHIRITEQRKGDTGGCPFADARTKLSVRALRQF